jgi:trehalose/maltose transport system substrate-binding protein
LLCRYAAASILAAAAVAGCGQKTQQPVTLSYFRLGWSQPDELPTAEPLSRRFVRETGIQLKNLPVPETTADQLDLSRKLLQTGTGPDVLGIDLIWSGVLQEQLVDLRTPLAQELSSVEPKLLPNYTVNGQLVAVPYQVQVGILEYRSDLLQAYGYTHPPKTWEEMEKMAVRVQNGERAKGKKDFWGYVWQGAAAEALTCNALEWQAAEGGGRIIEEDRTISVNNPAAVRSWERAKRWIGSISPPGVVAYRERDTMNIFDGGGAAFARIWEGMIITPAGGHHESYVRNSLKEGKIGYASIPGGPGGRAATLGGAGLAVSRHSMHPQEALRLARFLVRAEIETDTKEVASRKERENNAQGSDDEESLLRATSGVVSRPSNETGAKYEQVSAAYIRAVHAVLTGEKAAPAAAAELEKELIQITGFAVRDGGAGGRN